MYEQKHMSMLQWTFRILDIKTQNSQFLCTGCEIKLYFPLHKIMDESNVNKEEAYKLLQNL